MTKKVILYGLITLLSCSSMVTNATVTLLGNRVIYPAQSREKTLSFTNEGSTPVLVQIWMDSGDANSTPETGKAPFTALPQIFRINGKSGQAVRLVFTGKDLPTDRESLFYFNFLQIPGVAEGDANKNRLVFNITNRLKLFYRPKGLQGDANNLLAQITVKYQGTDLIVSNPTPYYASISQAELLRQGGSADKIEQADMIPPLTTVRWPIAGKKLPVGAQIKLHEVNDFGAVTTRTLKIQFQP